MLLKATLRRMRFLHTAGPSDVLVSRAMSGLDSMCLAQKLGVVSGHTLLCVKILEIMVPKSWNQTIVVTMGATTSQTS